MKPESTNPTKKHARFHRLIVSLLLIWLLPDPLKAGAPPDFVWVSQAGGSGEQSVGNIAVDAQGNSHVAGWLESDAMFGDRNVSVTNGSAFVAKYDASGRLLWVNQHCCKPMHNYGIACDTQGNTYITGDYEISWYWWWDIFVRKLNSEGNEVWFKRLPSQSAQCNATGKSIAVDSRGNCYLTGAFKGTVLFDHITLTASGSGSMFVCKLDGNGNVCWATKAPLNPSSDLGGAVPSAIAVMVPAIVTSLAGLRRP